MLLTSQRLFTTVIRVRLPVVWAVSVHRPRGRTLFTFCLECEARAVFAFIPFHIAARAIFASRHTVVNPRGKIRPIACAHPRIAPTRLEEFAVAAFLEYFHFCSSSTSSNSAFAVFCWEPLIQVVKQHLHYTSKVKISTGFLPTVASPP